MCVMCLQVRVCASVSVCVSHSHSQANAHTNTRSLDTVVAYHSEFEGTKGLGEKKGPEHDFKIRLPDQVVCIQEASQKHRDSRGSHLPSCHVPDNAHRICGCGCVFLQGGKRKGERRCARCFAFSSPLSPFLSPSLAPSLAFSFHIHTHSHTLLSLHFPFDFFFFPFSSLS